MMRVLRTPSRASASASVWPHMPPPMMSTSSAGLPSGPSTAGTQFGAGKRMRSKSCRTAAASSSSPVGSARPASVLLGRVIAPRPILLSCASSARRLASPPDLRSRRLPPAGQLHGLLVQEHHVDLAAGSRLVGGHDIDEAMARVVALDSIATRREDVRALDGEMAGPQAPLTVDSIGAC